jgi:hypothetical protein
MVLVGSRDMSLRERYRSGLHDEVYLELVTSAEPHVEAKQVGLELMRRVRTNLELLVDRWRALDFALSQPIGEPDRFVTRFASSNDGSDHFPRRWARSTR